MEHKLFIRMPKVKRIDNPYGINLQERLMAVFKKHRLEILNYIQVTSAGIT